MVLFKLNHDGFESIHAAKNKIDSVMCNLGQVDDHGRALSNQVFQKYYLSDFFEIHFSSHANGWSL